MNYRLEQMSEGILLGFYYYCLLDTFTSFSISDLIILHIPFPLLFPFPSPLPSQYFFTSWDAVGQFWCNAVSNLLFIYLP